MLMGRVMAPIDVLIQSSKVITATRASYGRLQAVLINVPIRDSSTKMKLPTPTGHVLIDKVVFAPPGTQKLTIKGISAEILPGDCVGIVGPSGSGKSTLSKLLVGVWKPVNGSIKLDGSDVYTYNREEFGAHVGYVPQDIELFNVSIKSNIAILSDEIDPVKVVRAAQIAGVHEFILSLPDGYDTIVGPGGVTFSGGQKQRIALARAFYGDIKFLVLDEPNSNLDQQGEQCLLNAIYFARQSRITVIFTTHKTQMIGITNKLMIMQDGMITSYGLTQAVIDSLQKQQNPNDNKQQEGGGTSSSQNEEQKNTFKEENEDLKTDSV
jgi:ATP-binding cassette subfamily B protein